jgi:hypothetical protein
VQVASNFHEPEKAHHRRLVRRHAARPGRDTRRGRRRGRRRLDRPRGAAAARVPDRRGAPRAPRAALSAQPRWRRKNDSIRRQLSSAAASS